MSNFLPKSVRNLIEEFAKLPGVGPKSAQRLAMHLLHSPESRVGSLGEAVLDLKKNVIFCSECWNIAEEDPCKICNDDARDHAVICVVEGILDTVAIEKTGHYKGLYHVLHGVLSPIDGVGPDQLKLQALFDRIARSEGRVKEVILATNPSLEGEATALYIQKYLGNGGKGEADDRAGGDADGASGAGEVRLTRIARGLPVGGDLEYADDVTLGRAINGRSDF